MSGMSAIAGTSPPSGADAVPSATPDAAGTGAATVAAWLGRLMPNLPPGRTATPPGRVILSVLRWVTVGAGAAGFAAADGRLVCTHDASLKRVFGVTLDVEKATLAEVRKHPVPTSGGLPRPPGAPSEGKGHEEQP